MNALQVNQDTGFLESPGHSGYQFDSERKVKFLDLANKHFSETGNIPDLTSICEAVGIHTRTFDNHLKLDENFAQAWRNFKLKGKYKLESKMYEYAQNKGGYMHMITWLRKEFPEEYNPEIKLINNANDSDIKRLYSQAIEAEIVDKKELKPG